MEGESSDSRASELRETELGDNKGTARIASLENRTKARNLPH